MSVAQPGRSAPATTYHVVTAVWGPQFIELFLNVCVPNQLSPRNLAALPSGSRYRIFTRPSDVPVLASSACLDKVRAIMPVDIVDLPELSDAQPNRNRYSMMTACHRRAAADAANAAAAMMFLAPDFVLAEGTLSTLVRLHTGGSRVVLANNLRLARAEFVEALSAPGVDTTLEPRDLVRLAMRYLHPSTQSLIADGRNGNQFPTSVYWAVRSTTGAIEGMLERSLHLHPLLLDPVRRDVLPQHTIDGHYVMDCCPDLAQCHIVEDSDELVVFELTPSGNPVGTLARQSRLSRLLRLAAMAATCNTHQLSHFQHSIRLHAGDLDEQWPALEARAAAFAGEFDRYRPAGSLLRTVYKRQDLWRRRARGRVRSIRRGGRYLTRAVRRNVRWVVRRRGAYANALLELLRPPLTRKQLTRPAKLWLHRTTKAGKLGWKRLRRRARLILPA